MKGLLRKVRYGFEDLLYRLGKRGTIIALAAVAVVAIAAVSFIVFKPSTSAPVVAADQKYTDVVTVPVYSPGAERPVRPRPDQMPPLAAAEGACADELNKLRPLFNNVESGLVMETKESQFLTEQLAQIRKVCPSETAKLFELQELTPWLNYAVTPPSTPAADN